ncbi:hypothetical protein [Streptomyces chartreusis]|uniref:hypothetical protein n=1 Tax=Streptomyces chartreusis TaxID=1969 RepID=UPI0037A5FD3C
MKRACGLHPVEAVPAPLPAARRPGALDGHPEWEQSLGEIDEHWNPAWPADWQRHYAAVRELLRDEDQTVSCRG